jgi:opacity protein-like surface antigen
MKMRTGVLVVMAGASLAAPCAHAQDWSGAVTLYGWIPGITGESKGRDGEPRIDVPGPDVLDALQFAFFLAGEVRRDDYGALFDLAYADLDFDAQIDRPVRIDGDLENKLYFASLAGFWRAYDDNDRIVDLYAGARLMGTEVDFGLDIGSLAGERSVTENWVDPILGVRGRMPLSERFSVSGRADFGGFGVGSELTWQAYGGLNYDFSQSFSGTLGYRYMSIDYASDDLSLDINLHGPVIGLTYTF